VGTRQTPDVTWTEFTHSLVADATSDAVGMQHHSRIDSSVVTCRPNVCPCMACIIVSILMVTMLWNTHFAKLRCKVKNDVQRRQDYSAEAGMIQSSPMHGDTCADA
jgi:hypothetical protein